MRYHWHSRDTCTTKISHQLTSWDIIDYHWVSENPKKSMTDSLLATTWNKEMQVHLKTQAVVLQYDSSLSCHFLGRNNFTGIVISILMLNDLGSYLKEITELVQKVLFFFCRVKRWVFLNDKHEHSLKTICDRFWIKTIITCPAIMWPRHTAPLSPTFSSLKKSWKTVLLKICYLVLNF